MNQLEQLTQKAKEFWDESKPYMRTLNFFYLSYKEVNTFSDKQFMLFMFAFPELHELDSIVSHFPTSKVVEECYRKGQLSIRQRAAITNILFCWQFNEILIQYFTEEIGIVDPHDLE